MTKRKRRVLRAGSAAAAVLVLLIALLSTPMRLAEGPLDEGYEICLATAREAGGASIRFGGSSTLDPGRRPVTAHLPRGQLALTGSVNGWWRQGWWEVHGLEGVGEYGGIPPGLDSGCLLARECAVRAVSWEALAQNRVLNRGSVRRDVAEYWSGHGMEHLRVEGIRLGGRPFVSTFVSSEWTRSPRWLRFSIYDVDEAGRPSWQVAKMLYPGLWCEPQVRLVRGRSPSDTIAVLVLDPPLLVSVYGWRGDRLTSVPLPWACIDDLVVVVLRSTWRWIALVAAASMPFAVARGLRRRRARADAAQ